MESLAFGCERGYIEQVHRLAQRNLLIHLYCSDNFAFTNLVDFYYRAINENAILMFLVIIAVYPILFMCVAFIADKYMSVGMQDLSDRFKLSPTLAAVTLIAFANGSPDVLSSLSAAGKAGGELISLGSLYGGFIFSSTLVVSNVIWNSAEEIKLPKLPVVKELAFYLLSVIVVVAFGLRKKTGYIFLVIYFALYAIYIVVTLILEKSNGQEGADVGTEEGRVENDKTGDQLVADEENVSPEVNADEKKDDTEEKKADDVTENADKKEGEKDNESKLELHESKEFFREMFGQVYDDGNGIVESIVIPPLSVLGMATVCYLENPLMKNPAKYIVGGVSIVWVVLTLELAELGLIGYLALGGAFAISMLLLNLVGVSQNLSEIIFELVSVFSAIGWIKIFSGVIIDFIAFLAFYFNINEVILSSILLSAGNTIGDFFGNGALAKGGASVMGAMASYSGQIFNNFIGFSFNILGGLSKSDEFDIFALDRNKDVKPGQEKPLPITSIFIIFMIVTVVLVIAFNFVYLSISKFTLQQSYSYILLAIYGIFFAIAMLFGYFSSAA